VNLSCQEKLGKVSVLMETNRKVEASTSKSTTELPIIKDSTEPCDFNGYSPDILMKETSKLRKLITQKGTLEILIPLCCTADPVRYIKFRNTLKGFSSKTLAARLKELQRSGILERKSYNETPPRVEYNLTDKGQELVESIIKLLQWKNLMIMIFVLCLLSLNPTK
jgi:DNA-binding HxlR family transcriptional regulator